MKFPLPSQWHLHPKVTWFVHDSQNIKLKFKNRTFPSLNSPDTSKEQSSDSYMQYFSKFKRFLSLAISQFLSHFCVQKKNCIMTRYFYNKANKQSYSIKLKIKYNICLNTFLWNTHNIFYLSVKLNNEIYAIQLFLNDFGVFLNSVTYDDCSGFRNVEFLIFLCFVNGWFSTFYWTLRVRSFNYVAENFPMKLLLQQEIQFIVKNRFYFPNKGLFYANKTSQNPTPKRKVAKKTFQIKIPLIYSIFSTRTKLQKQITQYTQN